MRYPLRFSPKRPRACRKILIRERLFSKKMGTAKKRLLLNTISRDKARRLQRKMVQPMRRIVVFGGRRFANRERLFASLDKHASDATDVIVGKAGKIDPATGKAICGADLFAEEWARERGKRVHEFYARWTKHGNAAGPIRNQKMIDRGKPECGIMFPGNKGTADMKRRLEIARIPIIEG